MKHKSRSYYKKRADRLFSLWIRQRDAVDGICRCVTCGTPHAWRSIHCGHFMSRRHESTRYLEVNAHAQCIHCNTYDQGRQFEHGQEIDKSYKRDNSSISADMLVVHSKRACKRGWFDYKMIGDELLERLKTNGFEIR